MNLFFSKHDRFGSPIFYCCEGSPEYVQLEKYYHVIVKKGYNNSPIYITKKYITLNCSRNNLTSDLTPKTQYKVELKTVNTTNGDKKYLNFRILLYII
jgi:hypothetical protein